MVSRKSLTNENYDQYSEKYRSFIYDYLYGNITVDEALQNVVDITKYYKISLSTEDSSVGLVAFIINLLLIGIIMASVYFLFNPKYERHFKFLSRPLWLIVISGCILYLLVTLFEYGDTTSLKCNVKVFFISLCYTLTLTPMLYQLLINFPEDNKISQWFETHLTFSMLSFVMVDFVIFLFTFIQPFAIQLKDISEGRNFKTCALTASSFNLFILCMVILYKILLAIAILILCFVEWNIKETSYDVKILMVALYINIIGNFLNFITNKLDIYNYELFFILKEVIYAFCCINNYMCLYGYRIILAVSKPPKENEDKDMLKKAKFVYDKKVESAKGHSTSALDSSNVDSTASNHSSNSMIMKCYEKMMKYHNITSSKMSINEMTSKSEIKSSPSVTK